MTSITAKWINLPEKWLRYATQITDMLLYFIYHIIALFSITTIWFALSLVSAATYFKDNPEQPYLPPHELLLQAWDNAIDLAFNTGLAYFVILYAGLGFKYWLKKQNRTNQSCDEVCR